MRAGITLLASLVVALAACGGGSSTNSSRATTTVRGVDPNATEVNPAGDIPDNQAFVGYTIPSGAFSVKVPEGWARTAANGVVRFTDKLNTVSLEQTTSTAAPTVASVRTRELPEIARAARHYSLQRVSATRRRSGPAVLAEYRVDSKPDAVTGKIVRDAVERFVFWRNGTEAILTLSGPVKADNVDPWRLVSDSFTWKQ
jgi:hypothetical protein